MTAVLTCGHVVHVPLTVGQAVRCHGTHKTPGPKDGAVVQVIPEPRKGQS